MARLLSARMIAMLREVRDTGIVRGGLRTLDALVRRGLVEITGWRVITGVNDVRLLASGRNTLLELERE